MLLTLQVISKERYFIDKYLLIKSAYGLWKSALSFSNVQFPIDHFLSGGQQAEANEQRIAQILAPEVGVPDGLSPGVANQRKICRVALGSS